MDDLVLVTRNVQMAVVHDEVMIREGIKCQESLTNTNGFLFIVNGKQYEVRVNETES